MPLQYIEPVVDAMIAVLEKHTPAACRARNVPAFRETKIAWNGIVENPPALYVLTGMEVFDRAQQQSIEAGDLLLVRAAFIGDSPDAVTRLAFKYAGVLYDAIRASFPSLANKYGAAAPTDWNNIPGVKVTDLWILSGDYTQPAKVANSILSRVDVTVAIETQEVTQ
jgi:hypothetical protein